MSVLARYRKKGGFRQLLLLIETSQPIKQEKLLEVVESEDPQWAELIRAKKLTAEIIFSWQDQHIATILEFMKPKMCAALLKAMDEERFKSLRSFIPFEKYKGIKEHMDSMEIPRPAEVVAAQNHLLETVRHLDAEKKLEIRYIAPQFDISESA